MTIQSIEIPPYSVSVISSGEASAMIYTHMSAGEAEKAYALTGGGFYLTAIETPDWNAQLSPWKAEKVFRGGEDFSGGAEEYLSVLLEKIIPAAESGKAINERGIAGYSLAGLFAIWVLYQTDIFTRAASMSGSLWYDGFTAYMDSHTPKGMPDMAYISLGDRECVTKNQRMAAVGKCTEEAVRLLERNGIKVTYELNTGGHFNDVTMRTARGIQAIAKG